MMVFLSGCAPTGLIAPVDDHSQAIADQSYSYTWDMQIPEIKSVDNLMMMQDGYYEKKPLTYTITKENVQELSYCPASEKTIRFVAYRDPTFRSSDDENRLVVLGEFNRDEIVEGRKIPLELLYEGE